MVRRDETDLLSRLEMVALEDPLEASARTAEILDAWRARGAEVPAAATARALEIHRLAFEVGGSEDGRAALGRWHALGGDAIRPAVARLAAAWREGNLDASLVPEDLPEPARGLLRLACRALLYPEESRGRGAPHLAEARRLSGSLDRHVPDLFRLHSAAALGERATLSAGLRRGLDARPVAAILAWFAAEKKRRLARHELPDEFHLESREDFLLAAAREETEGAGGEDSWEILAGSPLAPQYPASIFPWDPEALLGRVPLDALARKIRSLSEVDFGADGDRRFLGRLLARLDEALASGRLDVVHAVLPHALDRSPDEEPLVSELERLHRASGYLLGCSECAGAARLDLFSRWTGDGPGPAPSPPDDLLALCRDAADRPEAWPAAVRVRALAILAEAGETLPPAAVEHALHHAGGLSDESAARLIAALPGPEAWRARVRRALDAGDRAGLLDLLDESPRGPEWSEPLAGALREALDREAVARRYRGRERLLAAGGIRPLPSLDLAEADVPPVLDRIAGLGGPVGIETMIGILGGLRRAFGVTALVGRARADFRSLARDLFPEGPAGLVDFLHLLGAGLLCEDEAATAASIRALRAEVARGNDAERATLVWRYLLELESLRSAFPPDGDRIETWQRALLASISTVDEEVFWAPALAPVQDLPLLDTLGRFLHRMHFHLPAGAQPAILLARHHLIADLDVARARRWIREARRRLRSGWSRPVLMDRLAEIESMAHGLRVLVEEVGRTPRFAAAGN